MDRTAIAAVLVLLSCCTTTYLLGVRQGDTQIAELRLRLEEADKKASAAAITEKKLRIALNEALCPNTAKCILPSI